MDNGLIDLPSSRERLVPANPDMEPISLRHDQVRVLGVVAGLIRHYRRH